MPPRIPSRESRGRRPLAFAAGKHSHSAAVRILLAARAEVDAAHNDGRESQGQGAGFGVLVDIFWEDGKRGEKVWRFVCEGNYLIS